MRSGCGRTLVDHPVALVLASDYVRSNRSERPPMNSGCRTARYRDRQAALVGCPGGLITEWFKAVRVGDVGIVVSVVTVLVPGPRHDFRSGPLG
jgi:hypothetical protein